MTTIVDVGVSRPFNNGSANITVNAVATGSSPITTYTATPSPATSPATFTSSTPIITVTGLVSNTAYTYTITASNHTNTSTSIVYGPVTATTVPAAPTVGTPTITSTSIVSLPITAGATGGSAITSYIVSSSPAVADLATYVGLTSPLTVTGTFVTGTAYTFTVQAVNANGTSLASSASSAVTPNPTIVVVTPVVPGAPTVGTATVVNPLSVTLSFTAPGSSGTASITGYTVAASPVVGNIITSPGTTSPVTVVGSFVPNKAYTFTISAVSSAGTGAASAASNSVTPGVVDIFTAGFFLGGL